jgi:hypothetical protein
MKKEKVTFYDKCGIDRKMVIDTFHQYAVSKGKLIDYKGGDIRAIGKIAEGIYTLSMEKNGRSLTTEELCSNIALFLSKLPKFYAETFDLKIISFKFIPIINQIREKVVAKVTDDEKFLKAFQEKYGTTEVNK